MVSVAPGTREDVLDIMPVMASAFAPEFGEAWTATQCADALALPGGRLMIARDATATPIGFALLRSVLDESELMLLAVASSAQKQGVGTALLTSLIDGCKQDSIRRLIVEVRADNSAITFYRNYGFSEIGRRLNYYRGISGARRDAVTMHLILAL